MTDDSLARDLTLMCSRFSRFAARRADVGVSSVSWRVASTLNRYGPLRPREIAAYEQVTRPTATTVVQRLEHEGLVDRRPDPEDSRSWLVDLTEKGRAALDVWRDQLGGAVGPLLDELPPEDIATLRRSADILSGLLTQAERS